MNIFEFSDYKAFLNAQIEQMPKRGRGQARKLAEHLNVHPVVISQTLRGDRHLTPEHALSAAQFFGFDQSSTDFFVELVNRARATSQELIRYYDRRIERLRETSLDLKTRVVEHKTLSDEDKAIFYSNWFYSGIRLLTSVEGLDTVEGISSHFGLKRSTVSEVLAFLARTGLCTEKGGRYQMSVSATYVGSADKFVNNHRRNWRLKGLEKLTEPKEHDLFYSSPCTLSRKDRERVRAEVSKLIESFSKRVADSPSETLACLNIDWFEL